MASVAAPFMDDAKVIVSTYEELPRRRRPVSSRVASSTSTAAAPRQAGSGSGSYSRRALLLAYAQQLRRRRREGLQQSGAPLLLEWAKWKAAHPVAAGGDGGIAIRRRIGRNWCSRLRSCVRLWVRTFLRRVTKIRENASCKKGDTRSMLG